jgi:hypothetical protein
MFFAGTAAVIIALYTSGRAASKSYFLTIAIVEFFCSSVCYVIHIVSTRREIRMRNHKLVRSKAEQLIVRDRVRKRLKEGKEIKSGTKE